MNESETFQYGEGASGASPEKSVSSQPVMNLEAALIRMGGDRSLLAQLAEFYLADAPPLLQELDTALAAGDSPAVQRAAHRLNGLAANFDGLSAVSAAQQVEAAGRSGRLADCGPLVQELHRESRRLMESLSRQFHLDIETCGPASME